MKKKKIKTKWNMSLSVIIICYLASATLLGTFSTQALQNTNEDQFRIDSSDIDPWYWSTTEIVSTESIGSSVESSIATDSAGNVHLAWQDNSDYLGSGVRESIFYKRWNVSTFSWTTTEVVSVDKYRDALSPSLAIDIFGNVHIAWCSDGGLMRDNIYYRCWNVSTSSWTSAGEIFSEVGMDNYDPSLDTDSSGNVHLAWEYEDSIHSRREIYYQCWNVSTSSWTSAQDISTESSQSTFPSLTIDSTDSVHISWQDSTNYAGSGGDSDIFYKRWDSSISSWTTTEVVSTESTGASQGSSLVTDSAGNVHITWHDSTNYAGSGGDSDIFYKRWDSSNYSWSITRVMSIENTDGSTFPSLAVDSTDYVYLAWDDVTNYNGSGTDSDIFYKYLEGPLATPELAFIVPNPTVINTVTLDWNPIVGATTYYVYRSTSYIWSVGGIIPIDTVSSSDYIDTLSSEGFYYYVIVAGNFEMNSSFSNCQYVEVKFPDLECPDLAPLLPNPTEISSVSLVWDSIDGATEYYVYRTTSYIWSVEGLTPIATVGTNSYVDNLPSVGTYFYVIVASDGVRNSTQSNCEYVEYELPTLQEFIILTSLILGIPVILFVVTRIRKRGSKQN